MAYHRTERSDRVRETMRAKILRAARRLFIKRGFEATTMRDIVEASGTSTGNVYFYFENKIDLLGTMLETGLKEAWARGETVIARTPRGPKRLAAIQYATTLGLLAHDRDLTKVIAADTYSPIQARLVELNAPRARAALLDNLPSLRADEVEMSVAAWTGASRHCIRAGASGSEHLDPLRVAEFIVRWNLRGARITEGEIDDAIAFANDAFRLEQRAIATV